MRAMEARYFETRRGLAAGWLAFGFVFGAAFSLVMGDGLTDSALFGAAIGVGFAIAVSLFFEEEA